MQSEPLSVNSYFLPLQHITVYFSNQETLIFIPAVFTLALTVGNIPYSPRSLTESKLLWKFNPAKALKSKAYRRFVLSPSMGDMPGRWLL